MMSCVAALSPDQKPPDLWLILRPSFDLCWQAAMAAVALVISRKPIPVSTTIFFSCLAAKQPGP